MQSQLCLVCFSLTFAGLLWLTQCAHCLPGQGIAEALFQLKEMDMHIHCGVEREVGFDEWVDLSVADGRKVMVLLDHLELYRRTPGESAAWAKETVHRQWYPLGPEGWRAFMDDAAGMRKRSDIITFRGWEIYEGELDTGVEPEPMRLAEVIGWHISPNNGGDAPNGQLLIKRIKQVAEIQKTFPVPMILYHPFTMRLENLQKTAKNQGREARGLSVQDYRFFQPGEQEEVIRLLKDKSIYIEISRSTERYWTDPVIREALTGDIRPLAEGGVQFIVSTDSHHVKDAQRPFEPDIYCEPLGVTPQNTNSIVRELLALRARSQLTSHFQ